MPDAPLFALLYRSTASGDLTEQDVIQICETAERVNASRGITGLLLCTDDPEQPQSDSSAPVGHFVQWLEGSEENVRTLYEHIRKDPRHKECEVMAEGASSTLLGEDERLFPDWSMRFDRVESLPETVEEIYLVSDRYLLGQASVAGLSNGSIS